MSKKKGILKSFKNFISSLFSPRKHKEESKDISGFSGDFMDDLWVRNFYQDSKELEEIERKARKAEEMYVAQIKENSKKIDRVLNGMNSGMMTRANRDTKKIDKALREMNSRIGVR